MDTRLMCVEIMRVVSSKHPVAVPTHMIYKELSCDRRACQRQIKFLVEQGYLKRFKGYKVGLNEHFTN